MSNGKTSVPNVESERELRERLAVNGPGALSDAELLGFLMGEGTNGNAAAETARRLLENNNNSLVRLSKESLPKLRQSEGLGIARASKLAVAFELAERIAGENRCEPEIIRTDKDIEDIFVPLLSDLKHEELWIMYLTSGNRIIERRKVSQGGITSLVTDLKIILKRGVELLSSSVVLVHNHPSGVAEPSKEDIDLTNRLYQAAAMFDMVVLDHMIIAESGGTYSFRRNGLLK